MRKIKTAVLISGSGSNFQAIAKAAKDNDYSYDVKLVISNKKGAYGLVRAANLGIKSEIVSHKDFSSREEFDSEIDKILEENDIELICLAGFMRLLTKEFAEKWQGRLINIHPSLLPDFKGANAIKDAYEAGAKKMGCTVHYVIHEVDSGEILGQEEFIVQENDDIESLTNKMHEKEHILYPKCVEKVAAKLL